MERVLLNYNTMHSRLPTYQEDNERKEKCYRLIDYSEPLFIITLILGIIGIVYDLIKFSNFGIVLSCFMTFGSVIALWRVKTLGVYKSIANTADILKDENDNLSLLVDSLKDENENLTRIETNLSKNVKSLEKDIKKFRELMGIVSCQNKQADEIQRELFSLLEQHQKENERQEKNNKLAAFYTVDFNRDGKLSNEEAKQMSQILKDEYGISEVFDKNGDGIITRKELIDKLFKR